MQPFPNVSHHLTSLGRLVLTNRLFYELLISFMALEFDFHVFVLNAIFEFLYIGQAVEHVIEGLVLVFS